MGTFFSSRMIFLGGFGEGDKPGIESVLSNLDLVQAPKLSSKSLSFVISLFPYSCSSGCGIAYVI